MMSLREGIYSLETEYAVNFYFDNRGGYINPDELARRLCKVLIRQYGTEQHSFLVTGAKLERDTGHLEWSLPECRSAREVLAYDQAADFLLSQVIEEVEASLRQEGYRGSLKIFKNNVDSAGKSYGCHENYLTLKRTELLNETSFLAYLVRCLTPFLVTRQIFTGAGWLVPEQFSPTGRPQFALAQRTFFIEKPVSKETRRERAIINLARETEPLASGNARRLHLILGDSNLSPWATWLKLGIMGILLRMVEDQFLQDVPLLTDPVAALRIIALDPTCRATVALRNGKKITAINIQWQYCWLANEYLSQSGSSPEEERLLKAWIQALKDVERDPQLLANRADWAMKKLVLDDALQKANCSWEHLERQLANMRALDLRYHDLSVRRSSASLANWITPQEIQRAIEWPPAYTRARIRGQAIRLERETGAQLKINNWDDLTVDGQAFAMSDPLAFDEPTSLARRPFQMEWWRTALRQPELNLRIRAAQYLAWPKASSATDILLEVLQRAEEHELVRRAAVESLGLRADRRAESCVLTLFLHDPSLDVRWAAENALNRIQDGTPASPPQPPPRGPDSGASFVQILS